MGENYNLIEYRLNDTNFPLLTCHKFMLTVIRSRPEGLRLDVSGSLIVKINKDMNMSDIADRVKKIVVEHLGVDADKVKTEASFIDDLGADSLDTVELVMAFEEEFGIEIPDDAAETIQTVGDAVKFIEKAQA